ncbi:NUDIX hydrolase [Desulfosporosinus sp.]|uniref:NUDIX hydrolase n=1 Tax=Desulfosporosinus sp. TaxID=157907 RepID=UPI0025C4A645|nr:NUDIX hydrolase [Desulfosporosinus sp.]
MKCDFSTHHRMSVATDVVVLTTDNKPLNNKRKVAEKGLQILFVKRDEEPYNGCWALPAGFVNFDEPLLECAKRKLREKVGLDDIYLEQLYSYGDDVNRDIRGRVISIGYIALAPKEKILLNSERASKEAEWFWIESSTSEWEVDMLSFISVLGPSLKIKSLAFDHRMIIADALNRIKNKIMYTDVGFHLVNELFTVKELQTVYELLLGRQVQAFRRVLNDKIVETEHWTDGKAHRPARLFKQR